jgi:hypothetical protein
MKRIHRYTSIAVALTVCLSALALTTWRSRAAQVTYTKDIAPILFKSCTECHRAGESAPMSLMSYQEVRPWARSIRERISDGSMPPWSADPKVGHWANDPRLSAENIEKIKQWVAAGAPKGEDKDMPATPQYTTGWTIGKPDVVLQMQEEYSVPAEGTVPYLYFSMPTNFTEDKWVQAFEIRPSNRAVVHHVIAYSQDPNVKNTSAGGEGDAGGGGRVHIGGITPNTPGFVFKPGTAKLIKKGSNIVFQMHYTTMGTPAKDRTSIGFIFAKEPAKHEIVTGNAMNTRFNIPAGDGNFEVKASKTMQEDTLLTSFMPHMHVRGKAFTYTATYPDGRVEVLLNVPKYDFNWQHNYYPAKPILLPKGTKLDCVAYFDNSEKNKFNPDPTKAVRWGDQTWEEMMIGWYTFMRPIDAGKTTASASSSSGQ